MNETTTKTSDPMAEALTTAYDCFTVAACALRTALHNATAVEALVLMPLIGDTARLEQQIADFIDARKADPDA